MAVSAAEVSVTSAPMVTSRDYARCHSHRICSTTPLSTRASEPVRRPRMQRNHSIAYPYGTPWRRHQSFSEGGALHMRREPGNPPKQQTTRSAWSCIVIIPTENWFLKNSRPPTRFPVVHWNCTGGLGL